MFQWCHTVFYNGSGWSHDRRVTWKESPTSITSSVQCHDSYAKGGTNSFVSWSVAIWHINLRGANPHVLIMIVPFLSVLPAPQWYNQVGPRNRPSSITIVITIETSWTDFILAYGEELLISTFDLSSLPPGMLENPRQPHTLAWVNTNFTYIPFNATELTIWLM